MTPHEEAIIVFEALLEISVISAHFDVYRSGV